MNILCLPDKRLIALIF